jgi:excisionase family DNA binding protein
MEEVTRSAISPRQAAELLGVHASSIKRWCNAGALECWHTPGGHRRIPVERVFEFAESESIDCSLLEFAPHTLEVWEGLDEARRDGAFDKLVDLAYTWLAEDHPDATYRLLRTLLDFDFSLAQIFDRVIGPLMGRIGMAWEASRLAIGDEHRMTHTVTEMLIHLRYDLAMDEPAEDAPVAIVGCTQAEYHELGALMVRILLEHAGWHVYYLSADVPTEEFAAQQVKHRASIVAISVMPPRGAPEASRLTRVLAQLYQKSTPYRLAIGGSLVEEKRTTGPLAGPFLETVYFNKVSHFEAWMREAGD